MRTVAYAILVIGLAACLFAVFLGALVSGDQQGIGALAVALAALGIIAIAFALLRESK